MKLLKVFCIILVPTIGGNMLRSAKEIKNYVLQAKDGKIGRCKDFLFDDQFWTIRYMVASTGKWLPGRKVLISPISLEDPDWVSMLFPVRLTKEQVENSPEYEPLSPVERVYEEQLHEHYRRSKYWE